LPALDLFAWRHLVLTVTQDEYTIYCSEELLDYIVNLNLINKWKRLEGQFPVLAKMAFDILSIPAMSAKYKRIFSSAKHLLTPSRNSLNPESIKAVKCN
jgi:hAT family C-terminal dimerisation region